jgi:type IV secretory pathway TrbL component
MKTCFVIVLTCVLLLLSPAPAWAQTTGDSGVENITSQFSNSAQKWETSIKSHAVQLFWILAAIAAVWTFILLVLRQADFAELFGAVTRFTFVTFFFTGFLIAGRNSRQRSCNQRSRSVTMRLACRASITALL